MMTGCRLLYLPYPFQYRPVPRISCPLADGSFGMLLSLTLGVNKHNVAWHG